MSGFEQDFAEAVALHRAGRIEEAMAAYRRGLAADPAHLLSQWNLAIALDQHGAWEQTAAAWRRVLALQPDNMEAVARLGRALFRTERPAEAIEWLQRAAREPALGAPSRAMTLHLLLRAFHQLREWPAMEAAARTILASQPDDAAIRYSLGLALHYQRRWHEARNAYEQVLASADGAAPPAHHHLRARWNLGRAQHGLLPQDLRRYRPHEALEESGRNMRAGRLADAELYCRIVLQQAPGYPEALACLARIGRLSGAPDAVGVADAVVAAAPTAPHRQLLAWTLQGVGRLGDAIRVLDGIPAAGRDDRPAVRIVWKADPASLWESAWLHRLLDGLSCEHLTAMPDPAAGGPLLIVSGLPSLEEEAVYAALAAQGANLGLVLLSDEYYTLPESACAPFRVVFRNYWSERLAADPRTVIFPLGYKQGIAGPDAPPGAAERPYSWCFMGNATPPARQDMLRHLRTVPGGFTHLTDSFHDGKALSAEAYAAKLRASVFVPCPGGNNLETFRVYEALECGAIPIVEEWFAQPYYTRLLGPCPFPILRVWSEAPGLIRALSASPEALAERQEACAAWWRDTKAYFTRVFAAHVRGWLAG